MSLAVLICKTLNCLFPLPQHPFNLQNDGKLTYAQWQYQMGHRTVEFYMGVDSEEEMFRGKRVLDVGCGAGGKALYYASKGAGKVYGIDTVDHYKEEALALAKEKGLEEQFAFAVGDAACMPFEDSFFDTIIMNDAMEHVARPEEVLMECCRVLKPGGRLYINFPPYFHPYGAHLSDAIGIPWVHRFFSPQTLITTYRDLVRDLPDGQKRISLRIDVDGEGREHFSYINGMTVKAFEKLIKRIPLRVEYYRLVPLRKVFSPFIGSPLLREYFVKMVVCVMEKAQDD